MTRYNISAGKKTGGIGVENNQTGLLPAIGLTGLASGAVSALSIGALAGKGGKLLKGLKSIGKGAGKAAGGGTAGSVAKLGLGTVALDKAVKFMNSGPEIAGVNILPMAVIGIGGIFAINTILP